DGTRACVFVIDSAGGGRPMAELDTAALGAEWLRALRGRRSREAFARRLGCSANAVYAWETGRREPPATVLVDALRVNGHDLAALLDGLMPHRVAPPEPGASPGRIVAALTVFHSHRELSRRAKVSPFALSRWVNGRAEPRLAELLAVIQATTLRLLDL